MPGSLEMPGSLTWVRGVLGDLSLTVELVCKQRHKTLGLSLARLIAVSALPA